MGSCLVRWGVVQLDASALTLRALALQPRSLEGREGEV